MKIIIEDIGAEEEELIIVRCRELNEEMLNLLKAFRQGEQYLTMYRNDNIFRLRPKEIYYFESVDNRTFAYAREEVYEIRLKLYEIENKLGGGDFFRASKSSIVNLVQIKSLSPAFSGRLEAELRNGEKVIISRQYVPELKSRLGL